MHRYVRNGTSVPHAVLMIENCPDTGFSIPLIMYTKFVLTKFGLTSKILKLAGKCLMTVATIISTVMQCVRYVTRFAKKDLIHAFNFANLMIHNFVCD